MRYLVIFAICRRRALFSTFKMVSCEASPGKLDYILKVEKVDRRRLKKRKN